MGHICRRWQIKRPSNVGIIHFKRRKGNGNGVKDCGFNE